MRFATALTVAAVLTPLTFAQSKFDCVHPVDVPASEFGLYRTNRQRVVAQLSSSPNDVFLAAGSAFASRDYADTEIDFRNDSPFLWLSGWNQADSVVAFGSTGATLLFVPAKSRGQVIFDGDWDVEEIKKQHDVDEVYFTRDIVERLKTHFPSLTELYVYDTERVLSRYPDVMNAFPTSPSSSSAFRRAVSNLRQTKTEAELDLLRIASEIAALSHVELLKSVRPGWTEYEVDALFQYESHKCMERFQAYIPIVGAGKHGAVLHYIANDDTVIKDGDMMLIDAGGEFNFYASDITRSFPANGRFSPNQTTVYNIVLAGQIAAVNAAVAGASGSTVSNANRDQILRGLIAAGFVTGSLQDAIRANTMGTFMPHGLSHGVGMDVHDPSMFTYQPGYVFTIEPGVYFIDTLLDEAKAGSWSHIYNWPMIDAYRNFGGVRIEDVVLIRPNGEPAEVLSKSVPKSIPEIEAFMNGAPTVDVVQHRARMAREDTQRSLPLTDRARRPRLPAMQNNYPTSGTAKTTTRASSATHPVAAVSLLLALQVAVLEPVCD